MGMTKQIDEKAVYETPELNAVGSFEALTKWAGTGWALDAGFTIGTPLNMLTFSDPPRPR
jgi:hypothetical protein